MKLPTAVNIQRIINGVIMLTRNLVSVAHISSTVEESGTINSILQIIFDMTDRDSFSQMGTYRCSIFAITALLTYLEIKIINTNLQLLANYASQIKSEPNFVTSLFDQLVVSVPSSNFKNMLHTVSPESSSPLLLTIENCLDQSSVNCLKLYESENGQTLFAWILEYTPYWYELENDIYIKLVSKIVCKIITYGYTAQFLDTAIEYVLFFYFLVKRN